MRTVSPKTAHIVAIKEYPAMRQLISMPLSKQFSR